MEKTKGFGYPECKECTLTQVEAIFNNCTLMVILYRKAILKRMLGEPDLAKQLLNHAKAIAEGLNCLPARDKFKL